MSPAAKKSTWVEIHQIVLAPGERAPQVPDDTKAVPLEMTVKGFLSQDANVGDQVEIVTAAGRRVRGVLRAINPGYVHGFGPPIEALSSIGSELRAILRENDR
jgi:hypothetical protein